MGRVLFQSFLRWYQTGQWVIGFYCEIYFSIQSSLMLCVRTFITNISIPPGHRRTPTHIEPNKLYQLPQSELVDLVQLHMEENTALRTENSELFVVRDQLLRDQELLSRENERLLKKLEDVNSWVRTFWIWNCHISQKPIKSTVRQRPMCIDLGSQTMPRMGNHRLKW